MTRHLVMGGAGFLGRHVACQLKYEHVDADVVDLATVPAAMTHQFAIKSKVVNLMQLSVDELRELIKDYDVVHHYVWTTIPASANADPVGDLIDNVGFSLRLLQAAEGSAIRILFCSSGGTVYGRADHVPISEDANLNPLTAYGVSKVAVEKYCGYFRAVRGVDVVVARLANPYGAGQPKTRMQGVITRCAHLGLDGEPIEVWGDGSIIRDYVYVWDAARGLCAIANAARTADEVLPLFNIGGGAGASVNDVMAALARQIDKPLHVEYSDRRNFDVKVNVLNLSRAHDILNWAPHISLEEGVALLVADLRRDRDATMASRPRSFAE